MKYAALTLFFLLHFFCSFSQSIVATFETDTKVDVELRAKSFAHWWSQTVPHNIREGQLLFESINVNIISWMRAANMEVTQEQWDELFYDFHFYEDQPARFKEKIYRWMEDASAKCPDAWEQSAFSNGVVARMKFTPVDHHVVLQLKQRADKKMKLKAIESSGNACVAVSPFVLVKKNNKTKKTAIEADFKEQELVWNGSATEVAVNFSDGTVSRFSFKEQALLAPYIKEFFVNDADIFEGQKVSMTWYVIGAEKVELNENIGQLDSKWQIMVAPEDTTVYKIKASNAYGMSTKELTINVERTLVESMTFTLFTPEKADPKALGTTILLEVIDKHGDVVAYFQGLEHMEISGKTPYVGPFNLEQNEIILKKDFTKAFLRLSIPDSENNDKYTFSPIVIVKFSNGSKHELYGFGNKDLESGGEPVMIQFSTY